MKNSIKLFDPFVSEQEFNSVKKVLKSGFWASGSGIGCVSKFELATKKYLSTKSCIAVNNGTSALHLALSLVDLKGKSVILPSLSFVSTAHAVLYNGGQPIFAEIDPLTLNLDVNDVKKKIQKNTKLILPVHFAGLPANLSDLSNLAKNHNCFLIEDAAHAMGAQYNGKKIGSIGDMVCFSFHPVKNLAMPTGGLISINTKNHILMKNIVNSRRWCGITDRTETDYDIKELGWNFYMNEISAAIGLIQLKKLDSMNTFRQKTAKKYFEKINIENKMPFSKNSVYHFYWILVKNRDKLRTKLKQNGIETGTHYKPIHKMSLYKSNISLPVTQKISDSIITLPTHPNLSNFQIEKIIRLINKFSE